MPYLWQDRSLARDCRSAGAKTDKTCRICGKVGHLARDCRSKGAQKGGKGTKRGRGGPRSASDLDRENGLISWQAREERPKPTADELDAEMDAHTTRRRPPARSPRVELHPSIPRHRRRAAKTFRFDTIFCYGARSSGEFRVCRARVERRGRKDTSKPKQAAQPDLIHWNQARFAAVCGWRAGESTRLSCRPKFNSRRQ